MNLCRLIDRIQTLLETGVLDEESHRWLLSNEPPDEERRRARLARLAAEAEWERRRVWRPLNLRARGKR